MATCPECGGRLAPLRPLLGRPWGAIGCRWCRALLLPAPGLRLVIWLALGLAGGAGSAWLLRRFADDPPLFLTVVVAIGWGGVAVIGWLAESLLPLRTLIPRDSRRARGAPDESAGADAKRSGHSAQQSTKEP